ncbi:hypothetical protein CgunFtcFv8_018184 [Champsocephalus gunnari]|uniref:Uncharacterized protein n=1 Tax=Champsocephalus gunnari TaxID=52237 RepID=A0AAN8DPQ1_CHAGU|nr:hypothetical protein CgunFtcFv8_018181 [Champsocephalus gunnari]KAK5925679.1 hypothetical protein CgunFtcFv8_018184 [Champsocephalus gunnari]
MADTICKQARSTMRRKLFTAEEVLLSLFQDAEENEIIQDSKSMLSDKGNFYRSIFNREFNSSEISTCMFQYLSTLSGTEHVVLYSDTCGGQNRNAGFSAMCLHAVNTLPISIIDHSFMESGHSKMECDSVHAAIETDREKGPVVLSPPLASLSGHWSPGRRLRGLAHHPTRTPTPQEPLHLSTSKDLHPLI